MKTYIENGKEFVQVGGRRNPAADIDITGAEVFVGGIDEANEYFRGGWSHIIFSSHNHAGEGQFVIYFKRGAGR